MGWDHVEGVTGELTPCPQTLGATGIGQRSKTRKVLPWDSRRSPIGKAFDNYGIAERETEAQGVRLRPGCFWTLAAELEAQCCRRVVSSVPQDCGKNRDAKVKGEGLLGRAEARSSSDVHSGPAHSAFLHYLIIKRVHWLALLEAGPMRRSILTPSSL